MHKVVAVIPAYNAEKTIGDVVKSALAYCDVIVVDDGSQDRTFTQSYIKGVTVYHLYRNYGAGYATKYGLDRSLSYDVAVTLDADGQHNPHEISQLVKPIIDGEADVVVGSRFMQGKTDCPFYRKLGILIITWVYNLGHRPITDAQSCFRAFRVSELSKILSKENRFGFSTEMLIRARKYKLAMVEVPISCVYRELSKDSIMNPIKQGVSVLIKTILWRLRLWN
jgi:glycosyltransferase involved in cell wall biosynthesis